jgi:hypothetical protein
MEKLFNIFEYVMVRERKFKAYPGKPKVVFDMNEGAYERNLAHYHTGTEIITVHMMPLIKSLVKDKIDYTNLLYLGRAMVYTLAHEWRHYQQEHLYATTTIPRVSLEASRPIGGIRRNSEVYWNDLGEKDAREFAKLALKHIPDRHIESVGRLTRYIIRKEVAKAKAKAAA